MKLLSCVVVGHLRRRRTWLTAQAQDKTLRASRHAQDRGLHHGRARQGRRPETGRLPLLHRPGAIGSGAGGELHRSRARDLSPDARSPGCPAGVAVNGPENVASTLTVIAENGASWVFVAKGQKPLLPAGGAALVKPTTVNVSIVRRTDWAAPAGPRRGADLSSCLTPRRLRSVGESGPHRGQRSRHRFARRARHDRPDQRPDNRRQVAAERQGFDLDQHAVVELLVAPVGIQPPHVAVIVALGQRPLVRRAGVLDLDDLRRNAVAERAVVRQRACSRRRTRCRRPRSRTWCAAAAGTPSANRRRATRRATTARLPACACRSAVPAGPSTAHRA